MKVATMHERHNRTITDHKIQESNVPRSSFLGHAGAAIKTMPARLTTSDDRVIVVPVSTEDVAFAQSATESLTESENVSIDSLE